MTWLVCVLIAQSCPTLCDPMSYSPPGSSVHGIFQTRILEWVAISISMGSSRPRDRTHISWIGRQIFYHWATRKAHARAYLVFTKITMTIPRYQEKYFLLQLISIWKIKKLRREWNKYHSVTSSWKVINCLQTHVCCMSILCPIGMIVARKHIHVIEVKRKQHQKNLILNVVT